MTNEVRRYQGGRRAVVKQDRATAAALQDVYDEVRLAALKADGAMALAGHMMEGMTGLDDLRRSLGRGDQISEVMLAEIQIAALRAVKRIQSGLYDEWRP